MKSKKRIISITACVFGLVMICSSVVFGNNNSKIALDYASMSVDELAHSDIATAPAEWKQEILKARNSIIYSTSWAVDGQGKCVKSDGTVEILPEFSDLFPDWEVPKMDEADRKAILRSMEFQKLRQDTLHENGVNHQGYTYLFHPSETQSTLPFCVFYGGYKDVTLKAFSIPGSTYNGGFVNVNTGEDMIHTVNLAVDETVMLVGVEYDVIYGARASTYSTTGYANMGVHDNF